MFKHDLLSYLVISHIRSRTFSTGDINSKAFVVPVDRVFNLQKKNNTQDIAKYNPSNWKISVFQVIAKFVPDCFSYLKNGSFNQCTFGCSMDRKAADLRNEQRILEFSHYFLFQTSCSFAALFKGCAQKPPAAQTIKHEIEYKLLSIRLDMCQENWIEHIKSRLTV